MESIYVLCKSRETSLSHYFCSLLILVVSKYHEPEEHMNIYEVHLTIKVNTMWYFISGMLIRGKIFTRFLLNSINNEIKRLFTLNKGLNTCQK